MESERPLVTIALPIRDAEKTLPLALASILAQTYKNWELLALDDGSRDRSKIMAKALAASDTRVRLLEPNGPSGIVPRLNQALATARGTFLARMDADDVAYPTRLERQVDFLQRFPSIDLVGTPILVFGQEGAVKGIRTAPISHDAICARPAGGFDLFHPTWMGKLEWFRRYRYRDAAKRSEDQELLLRACQASQFANLPYPLLGYREEDINLHAVLEGRLHFTAAVAKHEFGRGQTFKAIAAILEQAAKSVVDITAVTFGVQSFLLRHRARPASPTLISEWEQVWVELNRRAQHLSRVLVRAQT